jgi:ankyrin repeat protein
MSSGENMESNDKSLEKAKKGSILKKIMSKITKDTNKRDSIMVGTLKKEESQKFRSNSQPEFAITDEIKTKLKSYDSSKSYSDRPLDSEKKEEENILVEEEEDVQMEEEIQEEIEKIEKKEEEEKPKLKNMTLEEIEALGKDELNSILIRACEIPQIDLVETLLKYTEKVDINRQHFDFQGRTCLHVATVTNSTTLVEMLIKSGADVNSVDKMLRTPVHISSCLGLRDVLLILLSIGGQTNVRDYYGYAPLHLSVANHHFSCSQDLLLFGADINFKKHNGNTCIHDALNAKDLKILQFLLSNGSTSKSKLLVNIKDKSGDTPLLRGVYMCSIECVSELINSKMNVNVSIHNDKDFNVFHYCARTGTLEMIELLYNTSAKSLMDAKNKDGFSPLHIAGKSGNIDAIQTFVQLGANINQQDNIGNTPLHYAIKNGKVNASQLLMRLNAKINIKNKAKETARQILKQGIVEK